MLDSKQRDIFWLVRVFLWGLRHFV